MLYDVACAAAATAQGLDPIVDALTDAGVAVVVEQTGGFTMVATIYLDSSHERWIGITSVGEGRWCAGIIEGVDQECFTPLVSDGDASEILAAVRTRLALEGRSQ